MDKYKWSVNEIDKMDFFKTLEIVLEEFEGANDEPAVFIDSVLTF